MFLQQGFEVECRDEISTRAFHSDGQRRNHENYLQKVEQLQLEADYNRAKLGNSTRAVLPKLQVA